MNFFWQTNGDIDDTYRLGFTNYSKNTKHSNRDEKGERNKLISRAEN